MSETKTRLLPLETAEYLRIGYDQLLKMVRLNQIPHYRIGRRVFFTKESLDLWTENQENQSVQIDNGLRVIR